MYKPVMKQQVFRLEESLWKDWKKLLIDTDMSAQEILSDFVRGYVLDKKEARRDREDEQ